MKRTKGGGITNLLFSILSQNTVFWSRPHVVLARWSGMSPGAIHAAFSHFCYDRVFGGFCCDSIHLLGHKHTCFAASSFAKGRSWPVSKAQNHSIPLKMAFVNWLKNRVFVATPTDRQGPLGQAWMITGNGKACEATRAMSHHIDPPTCCAASTTKKAHSTGYSAHKEHRHPGRAHSIGFLADTQVDHVPPPPPPARQGQPPLRHNTDVVY